MMYVIPKPIKCPYCDAYIEIDAEVYFDQYTTTPTTEIHCTYSKCGATWYSDGTPKRARSD